MAHGDVSVLVDPPPVEPWSYGLLDAAAVRTGDGRWQRAGFSFETDACAAGAIWEYDDCFVPIPPDAEKSVPVGIDRQHSTFPATLYSGVACTPIGIGDTGERARRRLEAVAPRLLERYVWDQVLAGATDITPTGGVGPAAGIGLLQHRIAWHYRGAGVLHAPRWVEPFFNDYTHMTEPARETKLGARWAYGAGYGIDATSGEPAVAGTVTVYGTGAVLIYRSDPFVPATEQTGAFDYETNLIQVFAEQTFAVALDCPGPWAVTITLPTSGGA